jgi:hypothetical protein
VVALHNGIFINTGLQPGAISQHRENRFNGFNTTKAVETARVSGMPCTRVKTGVKKRVKTQTSVENAGRR